MKKVLVQCLFYVCFMMFGDSQAKLTDANVAVKANNNESGIQLAECVFKHLQDPTPVSRKAMTRYY